MSYIMIDNKDDRASRLALNRVYKYRYGNTPGNVPLDDVSVVGLPAGQTWEEICRASGFDPDDEEISITCLTADWSSTGQQPWHKAGDYVVTGLVVEGHPFAVIPVDHGEEADGEETDDEERSGVTQLRCFVGADRLLAAGALRAAFAPFGSLDHCRGWLADKLVKWVDCYTTEVAGFAGLIVERVLATAHRTASSVELGSYHTVVRTPTSGTEIRLEKWTDGYRVTVYFGEPGSRRRADRIQDHGKTAGVEWEDVSSAV